MKILLVTRGSQGDVLPYLAVAEELRRRGHWKVMNRFTNLMVKDTINKQRQRLGMTPIQNFGYHAGSHSLNYLMYSPQLGETDPDWPFRWEIGGYCFNDNFSFEESAYQTMLRFVESGSDPLLHFGQLLGQGGTSLLPDAVGELPKDGLSLIDRFRLVADGHPITNQ